MAESLKFSFDLPVSTERAYRAWLDGYEFARFTEKPARIDPKPGGKYSSLGGEVSGQTLVATPFSHIVQSWRARDFPASAPDSQVDLKFEPTCTGCQVTLSQTGIPNGHSRQVLERWEIDCLRPLKQYFDQMTVDSVVDMDG